MIVLADWVKWCKAFEWKERQREINEGVPVLRDAPTRLHPLHRLHNDWSANEHKYIERGSLSGQSLCVTANQHWTDFFTVELRSIHNIELNWINIDNIVFLELCYSWSCIGFTFEKLCTVISIFITVKLLFNNLYCIKRYINNLTWGGSRRPRERRAKITWTQTEIVPAAGPHCNYTPALTPLAQLHSFSDHRQSCNSLFFYCQWELVYF